MIYEGGRQVSIATLFCTWRQHNPLRIQRVKIRQGR